MEGAELDHIVEFMKSIAKNAGDYLNENYGKAILEEKFDKLPEGVDLDTFNSITNVDIELQNRVAKTLIKKYPSFEFFGEEKPEIVFGENDKDLVDKINNNVNKYQWIVDPLDGTGRYFKRDARHGFFLGLLENNNFIASVAYNPKQDSLTYAIKGKGCFRNEKQFRFDSTVDDHIILNSKSYKNADLVSEIRNKNILIMSPKHTGTMYDMLFLQYAPNIISFKTNTHDHVLSLAVEEAGGHTLVYNGEKFVKGSEFNWRSKEAKKDANIPCYIASNSKDNAHKISKLVQKYLK